MPSQAEVGPGLVDKEVGVPMIVNCFDCGREIEVNDRCVRVRSSELCQTCEKIHDLEKRIEKVESHLGLG